MNEAHGGWERTSIQTLSGQISKSGRRKQRRPVLASGSTPQPRFPSARSERNMTSKPETKTAPSGTDEESQVSVTATMSA